MREQYLLQQVHGVCEAWDIEDLVSLGKRLRSCSYFAARDLMVEAVIVFCPYNYLLDPLIRESVSLEEQLEEMMKLEEHRMWFSIPCLLQMDINLSGQILVLDEAHNIEDCARESASFTLNYDSLLSSRDELESMIRNGIRPDKHKPLRDFCYSLIKSVRWHVGISTRVMFSLNAFCWCCSWIQKSQSLLTERGYESASKVWSGRDTVDIFYNLGITNATFNIIKVQLRAINLRTPLEVRYLIVLHSMISTSTRATTTQRCRIRWCIVKSNMLW